MSLNIASPASAVGPITVIDVAEPLKEFSVVTGKNGAGKSKLLEGISSGKISVEVNGVAIEPDEICLINYDSIPRSNAEAPDIWEKEIQLFWNVFVQCRQEAMTEVFANVRAIDNRLSAIEPKHLFSEEEMIVFLRNVAGEDEDLVPDWTASIQKMVVDLRKSVVQKIQSSTNSAQAPQPNRVNNRNVKTPPTPHYLLQQHLKKTVTTIKQLSDTIFDAIETEVADIGFDEFVMVWPTNSLGSGYFTESISAWFQKYAEALAKHLKKKAMSGLYGDMNVSAKDFVSDYGRLPWEVVNEVLAEADIPYTINHPGSNSSQNFQAVLTHKVTGAPVGLDSLSSGERAVLFLLPKFWIVDNKLVGLPKLILFDEVDATLHPSLTRLLTGTLRKLAKNKNSHVVLVTHSPSTVSLIAKQDPDAVFILTADNGNPPKHTLVKSTSEQAVHELTDGIISVTSSTTFVITEASTDEFVYRNLFEVLTAKGHLSKSPNIVFLRASSIKDDGNGGGSGQVRLWAEKLSEAGLPNFKGLIDLDYGNVAPPPIYVLDRYAIENFLLDPILIFARLLEKRLHMKFLENKIPEVFITDHNLSQLNALTESELQGIVDCICELIKPVTDKNGDSIEGKDTIEYVNGKKVSVPKWLLLGRGKQLHDNVKAVFDASRREANEPRAFGSLIDLSDILTKNIPGFIPRSLVDRFNELQS